MSLKKWVIGHPDRQLAKTIAEELDIDPFTALLALGRGITDVSELEYFLSDEPMLSDPYELNDIKIAADTINEAIDLGLKIAVYGDYDCDGIMATAIMYKYLKSRNANVITYIPNRVSEGYGLNNGAINFLKSRGVELLITVDTGIASINEIEYASSIGIVTVVTDHHLPQEVLPDAAAVVDPHRIDCNAPFKDICGATVAFEVICAVDNKMPEELIDSYADLLCVATIGDVMPLINENRSIVKYGVNSIKLKKNLGLTAIMSVAAIDAYTVDATKIAFGIVPRINAAGRMNDADLAFRLVTADNMINAIALANEVDSQNAERQKVEKDVFSKILKKVLDNGYNHDRVIVVREDDLHQGVLGIVASKLSEKFGRPAIVFSNDGTMCHGSGRSIGEFHLYNALKYCEDLLFKFGGHELAAGVSVAPQNFHEFREKINEYARKTNKVIPKLYIDFNINPAMISFDMYDAIKALEPFGNGNALPVFGINGAKLIKVAPIGNGKHLKLFFEKSGVSFNTLLFSVTVQTFPYQIGDILDIAFTLTQKTYKNIPSLSLITKAIKRSDLDCENIFDDVYDVDDYLTGNFNGELADILPDREEIGKVFKYLSTAKADFDCVVTKFISELGYKKTVISIKVLTELGLISNADGYYFVNGGIKTELTNSATYNQLLKSGEKDE